MLAKMDTAANISSVGVSPQQAMTTSGSAPWSLLAHCQMPIPPCNAFRRFHVQPLGQRCFPATTTFT